MTDTLIAIALILLGIAHIILVRAVARLRADVIRLVVMANTHATEWRIVSDEFPRADETPPPPANTVIKRGVG